MKLLVVDDEKNIRKGICKILSDAYPEIELLEAQNGSLALELFDQENPELVITDIKMPVMDGIELMRQIRRSSQTVSLVVLSGFDDFSFAREALRNGASSYILKPLEKQEFLETIGQLVNEKRMGQKELNERLLRRGFNDEYFTAEAERQLASLCPYRIMSAISETHPPVEQYVLSLRPGRCILLLPADIGVSWNYRFAGISSIHDTITTLQEAVREARISLFGRFMDPATRTFERASSHFQPDGDIGEKINRLNSQIGIAKDEDIVRAVDSLFSLAGRKDVSLYLYLLQENLKAGVYNNYTFNHPLLPRLKNLAGYLHVENWRNDILIYLQALNDFLKDMQPDLSFVTKAIAYIEQHYKEDINMAVIANEVDISYTYFSEKFKDQTGINFNDYLKRLRIEKAKRLLEKGCYRIYEVAELSGFSSPRYFIRIFKQETGLTPTTYQVRNFQDE